MTIDNAFIKKLIDAIFMCRNTATLKVVYSLALDNTNESSCQFNLSTFQYRSHNAQVLSTLNIIVKSNILPDIVPLIV